MKRRIVLAIMISITLAVVVFAVPLGVVIDRVFEDEALLRLERVTILAERDIPSGWRPGDPLWLDDPGGTTLGVYDPDGARVFGAGPTVADQPVLDAVGDRIGEAETGTSYVITVPILDNDQVVAVLRAEQPLSVTDRRIRAAWASMGLLGFAVITLSGLLGRWLAQRIAVPVEALHRTARQLGTDGEAVTLPASGLAELDDVAVALKDAATRVADSVERERAFTASVSHQLRTPITGLRLLLETEQVAPRTDRGDIVRDACAAVARLEATVEELLLLARHRPADRSSLDLADVLVGVDRRWRQSFDNARRSLQLPAPGEGSMQLFVSASALDNIVDVLVDNALRHGQGTVSINWVAVDGGVSVRVADEGNVERGRIDRLLAQTPSAVASDTTRIGLRFAGRLAHAEGGELICTSDDPTTFALVVPHAPPA